jgi:hypothetical protein
MTIKTEAREIVKQRANYVCEYCGVSEVDVGGELTLDHYHPTSKGGSDGLENLLYCCPRCNQYKLDYWPTKLDDIPLWHPQREPFNIHFTLLDDGVLLPLTQVGEFTLLRLGLNRPHLISHRRQQIQLSQDQARTQKYVELSQLLARLLLQHTTLLDQQQELLQLQRRLIERLLKD